MLNAILGMNHLAKVRVHVSLCGSMTKGRAANATWKREWPCMFIRRVRDGRDPAARVAVEVYLSERPGITAGIQAH